VIADAVVADSAAVVLFGGDDRCGPSCRPDRSSRTEGDALVAEFGDALRRFDARAG